MYPRFPTPYPDGGGALAGGEVRLGEANKRARSAIGLNRDGLAAKTRLEMPPASSGGGVVAARLRKLGFRREKGQSSTMCGTGSFHVS
jgi:hypothetical protein